ncbi:tyrosine-type recombinase/integrase [Paenibacillus sp. OAE614]|uniref:tyrosine-type recombinase/integrase n=1 Tax=Paenibacillus sp. OAE614 TaxID=2663804 RepID=UPI00178A28F3
MSFIERKSKISSLREELLSLISQYGHQIMTEAIESSMPNLIPNTKKDNGMEPSFHEACTYFLQSGKFNSLSDTTKKSYRSEIAQYSKFISKTISEENPSLSTAIRSEYLLKFLEPYKKSNTYMKKSAFFRTFMQCIFSYYHGKTLDQDMKDLLPIIWSRDELPKSFTKLETAELLSLASSTNHGDRDYAILWTLLSSGIRLNELCNLQIKDILFEEQIIMVTPKRKPRDKSTSKVKRIITKLGLSILTEFINSRYHHKKMTLSDDKYANLYIFSASKGDKPISGRAIQYMVRDLVNSAVSIPTARKPLLTVHSFRHTFAIYGLESGLDIYTLSKFLGHSSVQSTSQYLKLADDQLRNAINRHPFAKEIYLKMERSL